MAAFRLSCESLESRWNPSPIGPQPLDPLGGGTVLNPQVPDQTPVTPGSTAPSVLDPMPPIVIDPPAPSA